MNSHLLSIALMTTMAAAAATYHFDSVQGNDANNGLSPQTAWKSLSMLDKADIKPGDAVLFKCGSLWRSGFSLRSGEPGKPVFFGHYGDGEKPIFEESMDASEASLWEEYRPGIWRTIGPKAVKRRTVDTLSASQWSLYTEAPVEATGSNTNGENGVPTFKITVQKGGKEGRQIQCWGADIQEFGDALRVHVRGRCKRSVTIGSMDVMYGTRPWSVFASGIMDETLTDEWKEFDVMLIRSMSVPPSQPLRLHWRLGDVLQDGDELELQLLGAEECDFVGGMNLATDVGNIIFDHGAKPCGWKKWTLDDLQKDGDYVYSQKDHSVYLKYPGNPAMLHKSIELALRNHIISHGGVHDVVVNGLTVRYGAAHGFAGSEAHRITVRNCDIYYIGGGDQYMDGKRRVRFGNGIEYWASCSDILVENNRLWEIYDAALTPQGYGSKEKKSIERNLTFRNNVIWNCEYSFEYFNRYHDEAITENVLFENNTCVNAGMGWGNSQRPNKNGGHLMFNHDCGQIANFVLRNNIFFNTSLTCLRMNLTDWTDVLVLDNNLWGTVVPGTSVVKFAGMKHPDGSRIPDLVIGMDNFETLVKTKKIGQTDSVGVPLFIDAAKHDYRLQPDSPGYGKNVGCQ